MSQPRSYSSHQQRLMLEALDIVGGARQRSYGPPERNFDRIACLWNGYLEASASDHGSLNAIDVCHMMDLVKLARLIQSPDHEDSMRDRFGYQACYVDLVMGDEPLTIDGEMTDDSCAMASEIEAEAGGCDCPGCVCIKDPSEDNIAALTEAMRRLTRNVDATAEHTDWPSDVEPPYVPDEQRPSDEKLRQAFAAGLGR